MRCKVCDYRLWNLQARQCPQCGTAFAVSDYEFIPNSVRFCCPDCGQAYYGTGAKGHLVPEEFVCVKCGQPVHMNDVVLLPTEGVQEERTAPQALPWLDRKRDGWWRSWWWTVGMSLLSPGSAFTAAAARPTPTATAPAPRPSPPAPPENRAARAAGEAPGRTGTVGAAGTHLVRGLPEQSAQNISGPVALSPLGCKLIRAGVSHPLSRVTRIPIIL